MSRGSSVPGLRSRGSGPLLANLFVMKLTELEEVLCQVPSVDAVRVVGHGKDIEEGQELRAKRIAAREAASQLGESGCE